MDNFYRELGVNIVNYVMLVLGILCTIPAHAHQSLSALEQLKRAMESYDAQAFEQTFQTTKLSTAQCMSLMQQANTLKQKLDITSRRADTAQDHRLHNAGVGALLLMASAAMASPVIMAGLESKGNLSKFLNPSKNVVYGLWYAMQLAKPNNTLHTLSLSAGTFSSLWPTNTYLRYFFTLCLYSICTVGSIYAGHEGGVILRETLITPWIVNQKRKNIEKIIELLSQKSRLAKTYHSVQRSVEGIL